MIDVIEPGFATSVQDEGRPGYYKGGIAPSGAMDLISYRLGNALVGNRPGAAGLELTFTGPRLRFDQSATIAVTGGDLPIFLNGQEVAPWTAHQVEPDDVLSFGFLKNGVRAYLGVSGGIDVPIYLGSRSTHVLTHLGGFQGRSLQAGDTLPIGDQDSLRQNTSSIVAERFRPRYGRDVELRFVPGLFDYRLTTAGLEVFCETDWTVTPNADRTGIRMGKPNAEPLEFVERGGQPFGAGSDPSNVVDAGYPIGAIQIPSGVEPIVLSRDAVTAGGYFTAGAIISADLDKLGQAPTHGHVRFVAVTAAQALEARRENRLRTNQAIESLA